MKQIKKIFLMALLVLATMVLAIFAGGCGNLSEKVDQLMCDHDYASLMPVTTVEPTCAEEGEQVYTCSKCNKEKKEDIPATGHAYADVKELQAATCTVEGIMLCRCEKCGEMKQEPIAKEPHTVVTKEGKEATCEEDGYTEYSYCSACNKVYVPKTVLSKFGHIIVKDAKVAPTCTLPGKTEGNHCSRCGEVFLAQETINPLNHSYVNEASTPATCTKAGWAGGNYCTRCGDVEREGYVIPMVAHNYSEVDGNCTECGKHQHTAKALPAKAATCTETGLTDGEICKFCGSTLRAQETTPATGHTFNEQFICSICGAEHEHDVVEVAAIPATCTEDGKSAGTKCSTCGGILSGCEVIEKLSHKRNVGEENCSRCGVSMMETDGVLKYAKQGDEYKVIGVVDTAVINLSIPYEFKNRRVNGVETRSFYNCNALECITFESIVNFHLWEENTFEGCPNLREITFSNAVGRISGYVFSGCKSTQIKITNVAIEGGPFTDRMDATEKNNLNLITLCDVVWISDYAVQRVSATIRIENIKIDNYYMALNNKTGFYFGVKKMTEFTGKISVPIGLKAEILEAAGWSESEKETYGYLIVEEETVTLPQ